MRCLISSCDSGLSDSMRCRVSARRQAGSGRSGAVGYPRDLSVRSRPERSRPSGGHGRQRLALADADDGEGKFLGEVGTADAPGGHGRPQSRVSSATAALAQASSTRALPSAAAATRAAVAALSDGAPPRPAAGLARNQRQGRPSNVDQKMPVLNLLRIM